MRASLTALSLIAFLGLTSPPSAHAQVSGLLKKKIKEAVKAPDKKEEASDQAAAGQGPHFSERMVELKNPVGAGLIKGLDTEVAQLTEFKRLLMTYKTEDQYEACQQGVAMLPEAQQIAMQMGNLPANATTEQVQAVTEKMNTAMNALIAKKCGASIAEDWPPNKRQAKIDEIHRNAAAAAGLLLRGSSPGQGGGSARGDAPAAGPAPYDPAAVGAPAIGPTAVPPLEDREAVIADQAVQSAQQAGSTAPYDIAWERFKMFCAYKKAKPDMFKNIKGYNLTVSASFYQQGLTGNVYFSAAEVEELTPMCDSGIFIKTGEIEVLMDEIKITGRRKP